MVGLAKKAGFGLPANAQLVWGPKLGNVIKLAAKKETAEGHRILKEIQKELIRKKRQQKQTEAAPSEKGHRKGQRAEA